MFSRDFYPLHVFPRLSPVTCLPALTTRFMRGYQSVIHQHPIGLLHYCCSDLRRKNFDSLLHALFNCSASHPPVSFISLTLSNLILSVASLTRIKQLSGRNTSSIYSETCQTSLTGQTCHDTVWSIRTNQCKAS